MKRMKQILARFFLFSLFVLNFHCGSPNDTGDITEGVSMHPNQSINVGTNISAKGGSIELPGVAKLEFPEGSFSKEVKVTMQEGTKQSTLDRYTASAVMFDGGNSLDKYLRITSSIFPEKDATIRYHVQTSFLNSLGADFVPRLFVQMFQTGADDEQLDYFEPLDFNLEGNVLIASVPKESFTALRSGNENEFETILLIGSSPKKRIQTTNSFGMKALVAKSSSDNICEGATIGSPLEGEPKLRSAFGSRIDPISGKPAMHLGVDLIAGAGDKVLAVVAGAIEWVKFDKDGWGYYVVLKHNDGSKTLYAHLLEDSTNHIKVGDQVIKGAVIGQADTSGKVTGPHLHLEYAPNGEIFNRDVKIDPFPCINASLEGQITISDNGPLADDAFSLTLDDILIGTTIIGTSNTFAISNLRLGEHTIRVTAVIAPDNIGTLQVDLGDGATFTDGTQLKSANLAEGESAEYTIQVGSPASN